MCGDNQVDYDPAEHRVKHCWGETFAAFVEVGSGYVGKCPSTLSKEQAKELVNAAVYEGMLPTVSMRNLMPERVWNVYQGVVYEAVPTRTGAYHGYPWRGRPSRNRLPRPVLRTLHARAVEQGYEREFKDWLATYES